MSKHKISAVMLPEHEGRFIGDLMDNRRMDDGTDRCLICGKRVKVDAPSIMVDDENRLCSDAPEYAIGPDCEERLARFLAEVRS